MKNCALIIAAVVAVLSTSANAYAPQSRSKANPAKPLADIKKAVASTFVAATIASNAILPMGPAEAADFANFNLNVGSSNIIAEKVIREGLYQDYEIDVTPQSIDSAESTFKSAKETKSKKGKYTALLAVLIVGSFVIPMAQYFWYVRDDDSTEKFFGQKAPEPEPEPVKKKGWFN
eukprot:CAMPEP_0203633964 /NCGR_PEP_ID=MMETSP0088-20131115/1021_1 /ASSEMBLY_ACC=CAM_ASM_001087 /TAXON_ID=426623 /ORGANISM="Chaetoceros affinis, Strain CCMP159" /LENGTH=175 /DNA_ID=CAMNT_0050487459 /DNA_START=111 /DNA_END=638 /DNA_ORIENTATION=-